MWYIITLSALLYSCGFFLPPSAFCIIFSPIPLIYAFKKMRDIGHAVMAGILWGSIVFGSISVWALMVLWRHADVNILVGLCLYGLAVGYFSLTVALWFCLTWGWLQRCKRGQLWAFFVRWLGVVSLGTGYFFCVEHWILFPLGKCEGYPFIMPYVPLARYKVFLLVCKLISCCFNGIIPASHDWQNSLAFEYLTPVVNKQHVNNADNPSAVGHEIYWNLCKTKHNFHKGKEILFVGAESLYPFVLNKHPEMISLWRSAIDEHEHLLLGGYYEVDGKLYQTIFQWNKSRIMHFYVKKHCVAFVEKIHAPWRNMIPANNLFLKGRRFFSQGKNRIGEDIFRIPGCADIIPQICSELFMKTTTREIEDKKRMCQHPAVIVFVNDSWFVGYFKQLMKLIAKVKTAWWGIDIVYVSHDKLYIMYAP